MIYSNLTNDSNMICENNFSAYYLNANFEPLTITFKPERRACWEWLVGTLTAYFARQGVQYYFTSENEQANVHLHGIIDYNYKRRNVINYINKKIGKIHQSKHGTGQGWYDYIHKAQMPDDHGVYIPGEYAFN